MSFRSDSDPHSRPIGSEAWSERRLTLPTEVFYLWHEIATPTFWNFGESTEIWSWSFLECLSCDASLLSLELNLPPLRRTCSSVCIYLCVPTTHPLVLSSSFLGLCRRAYTSAQPPRAFPVWCEDPQKDEWVRRKMEFLTDPFMRHKDKGFVSLSWFLFGFWFFCLVLYLLFSYESIYKRNTPLTSRPLD